MNLQAHGDKHDPLKAWVKVAKAWCSKYKVEKQKINKLGEKHGVKNTEGYVEL